MNFWPVALKNRSGFENPQLLTGELLWEFVAAAMRGLV
jgi:hypothetical protein